MVIAQTKDKISTAHTNMKIHTYKYISITGQLLFMYVFIS